jgi:hypothetical protein
VNVTASHDLSSCHATRQTFSPARILLPMVSSSPSRESFLERLLCLRTSDLIAVVVEQLDACTKANDPFDDRQVSLGGPLAFLSSVMKAK